LDLAESLGYFIGKQFDCMSVRETGMHNAITLRDNPLKSCLFSFIVNMEKGPDRLRTAFITFRMIDWQRRRAAENIDSKFDQEVQQRINRSAPTAPPPKL
jgi:hypothetical protein